MHPASHERHKGGGSGGSAAESTSVTGLYGASCVVLACGLAVKVRERERENNDDTAI